MLTPSGNDFPGIVKRTERILVQAAIPTTNCSIRYRAPVPRSRRACWWPSVSRESASRAPQSCRSTLALLPSRSAAASRPGSTGAGNAQRSCDRPLSSGPRRRSTSHTGRACIIISSEHAVALTRPLSEHWRSSGSAYFIDAGKPEHPMTRPSTLKLYTSVDRPCSK